MRRCRVLVVVASVAAVWGAGPLAVPGAAGAWAVAAARGAVPAGAVRAAGLWGRATGVPGLGALNRGGYAEVLSVSCASPGNCAAGGLYRNQGLQGFVVSERNGRWRRAIGVPGLGALNKGGPKGGKAWVISVSCGSAGNCAAGGFYRDGGGHLQGFVAVEKNGRWGRATGVPGLGALNKGGDAGVLEVSCASAGNCAAGGHFRDGGGHHQGFVVSERNGRWGRATGVPGLETLNKGGYADVKSVSCASAGNCAAGGYYRNQGRQGFAAVEKNGRWGRATGVPGLGALNKGGSAEVLSVSCGSPGNCAAGGDYTDSSGGGQAFVAVERNGVWGRAIGVPGLRALYGGSDLTPDDYVGSVSCTSAGNCAAGGSYGNPYSGGFVASEKNGVWGRAISMPGTGILSRFAGVSSVSCASAGNCAAGGVYFVDMLGDRGFVAVEQHGRWGRAIQVPGLAALNKGREAGVGSVSCASAGNCAAGGGYTDGHGHQQGFVT